jgi:16S rRNA (cytosine967-C5)-methyltransferase
MKALSVRVCAALALMEVMQNGSSLASAIPKHSAQLIDKDQALLQELCFGVCRFYERLHLIGQQFLQKPFKKKDADIEALVYLGIYQLLFTRIPDHAAISATVDASIPLKKPWAKGLLNAVLRNVQRVTAPLDQHPWANNTQYRYSHPDWIVQKLQQAWPENWSAILDANNQHPPMSLRVNRQCSSRDNYLQSLQKLALGASAMTHSLDGIQLDHAHPVTLLPGFEAGHISVQDESAQLAAGLLDLRPGQRVLDACCAPGGKTCHILETESQLQEVVAVDLEEKRMERVQQNLQRLGLTATLKVADAVNLDSWWDGRPFDRILLDAPCSATGVIRRHPDIKLLRRPSDIDRLAELQGALLSKLWQTLAPGGLLLYATCSVFPDENEQVVEAFLKRTSDAEHQPIDEKWGTSRLAGRQLFPEADGGDGFYYARLRKLPA